MQSELDFVLIFVGIRKTYNDPHFTFWITLVVTLCRQENYVESVHTILYNLTCRIDDSTVNINFSF